MFEKIYEKLCDEFVKQFNELTSDMLKKGNIKELIKQCFMKKYSEFEERLKTYNNIFTSISRFNTVSENEN